MKKFFVITTIISAVGAGVGAIRRAHRKGQLDALKKTWVDSYESARAKATTARERNNMS